jgi:Outer membrane protein beta-barrel domain
MRNFWLALVLAASLAVALPLTASAVGLDLEANAGAGLGLGSTSNPNETGSPRFAFQGGIEADLFLVSVGPVDLGISTGLEYDNMTNHGTVTYPGPLAVDSDNNYVYLIVPFAITSRISLSQSMNLSLRAGGFYGFFMGGQATNITNQPVTSQTFDSSNTPTSLLGLHFSGGLDYSLGGNLFLSPSIIFNMGLTNTTGFPPLPFSQTNYTFPGDLKTYSDSLWSLTLMIGLKYNVL